MQAGLLQLSAIRYIGETLLNRPQFVLRAATRLVLRKLKYDSISADIRDKFHWLPVKQRIEFKFCVLVFKCRLNEAPVYLSEMLPMVQRPTRYNLVLIRDSTMTFLDVRPFAPDLAVLLFPDRYSGQYTELSKRLCVVDDSKHGYLRKNLDSWNCVLQALNCIVRESLWWLTTIRGHQWNK